jgi:hypothetical protein
MNPFAMPTNSASADWLIFIAILLAIGIGIACFIIWIFMFRKSSRKRKLKKNRRHRQVNPTLAQTGGLPPLRNPGEPPRGT